MTTRARRRTEWRRTARRFGSVFRALWVESSRVESSRRARGEVDETDSTRLDSKRNETKRALGGRTSVEAPGTETRWVLLCDCVRDFNSVSTDGCSVL